MSNGLNKYNNHITLSVRKELCMCKMGSMFVYLLTGTMQGGISSPYLFAVCIDDVLTKLQGSSLGCHVYYACFNAFIYADDLFLHLFQSWTCSE